MIDEMEQYTGCNVAAKSGDLDEVDKESIHLLVFLFMQFLSCSDQVRFFTNVFVHFETFVLLLFHILPQLLKIKRNFLFEGHYS